MRSSNHNGRRPQRPPVERSLLALAMAQAEALRSREALRAARAGKASGKAEARASVAARPAHSAATEAAQRAQFAAAIARSEFGRFYFKGESGPAPKGRRPQRNGKG